MKVCKIFQWDAAHKLLLDYESKCNSLHGHTYKIEFVFEGPINSNGMVIDFGLLKEHINRSCSFDHQYLNDLLKQPTAENLVDYLYQKVYDSELVDILNQHWSKQIKLCKIRVWETPTSYAEDNY